MLKLQIIFVLVTRIYSLKTAFQLEDNLCGIMSESAGLIQGGELSKRNQFPWMAIISIDNTHGEWAHLGSGSLISHKHVLAHAFTVSYADDLISIVPVRVDRVKILLGTTKYDDLSEDGSMIVGVLKILNHPYAKRVMESLDVNKISIITIDKDVIFTQFIRPVCLWPFESDLSEIVAKSAYIAGYGGDDTGHDTLTRKHVRITVQEDCEENYKQELEFQNETRLFCAVGEGGPCMHDTQLYMKIGTHWFIKGLMSTVYAFPNGSCNVSLPALYEDIEPNIPVIKLLMSQ